VCVCVRVHARYASSRHSVRITCVCDARCRVFTGNEATWSLLSGACRGRCVRTISACERTWGVRCDAIRAMIRAEQALSKRVCVMRERSEAGTNETKRACVRRNAYCYFDAGGVCMCVREERAERYTVQLDSTMCQNYCPIFNM
jgi:hypothetical protein